MPRNGDGVPVASLVRNGVVESVHLGHVVVCGPDGSVLGAVGDPQRLTYVRSAVKPFQALAVVQMLDDAGVALDDDGLAIACASHSGSDDQQIEAARLLAEAELDESALQCPPAVPCDPDTAWAQRWPYPLSHNCSGKHAAFLLASVAAGEDPAEYLNVDSPMQRRVREVVADVCDSEPQGPGVDGCGAPAWLLPLRGLATGFARLAAGHDERLRRVRGAMTGQPALIGGPGLADTQLMLGDGRIVAKRGAEAVFGAGILLDHGTFGVAVKIADGGTRAGGPVAGSLLAGLGGVVADTLGQPAVLGGGVVQGGLEVEAAVGDLGRRLAG